jgi:hypothetical protein
MKENNTRRALGLWGSPAPPVNLVWAPVAFVPQIPEPWRLALDIKMTALPPSVYSTSSIPPDETTHCVHVRMLSRHHSDFEREMRGNILHSRQTFLKRGLYRNADVMRLHKNQCQSASKQHMMTYPGTNIGHNRHDIAFRDSNSVRSGRQHACFRL